MRRWAALLNPGLMQCFDPGLAVARLRSAWQASQGSSSCYFWEFIVNLKRSSPHRLWGRFRWIAK